MNITLTGSLGNVSRPLAEMLISKGHNITIISSQPDRAAAIEALGAKPAIGSVNDVTFLTNAFKDADAVYTMIPPNFGAANYRAYMNEVSDHYAAAIEAAGVRKVVTLSSIGAHLPSGTGPISGLYDMEQRFSKLEDVAVKHLRAAFFYVNFFTNIDMIKQANIIGANYGADNKLVMVHPEDIAEAVAAALEQPFTGKSFRYVVSDERTLQEVAGVLGNAIGKPELPWVAFTDEDALKGMTGAGLPESIAVPYVEMGTAVRNGKLFEDYEQNKPVISKTKLEDFAREFAAKFG